MARNRIATVRATKTATNDKKKQEKNFRETKVDAGDSEDEKSSKTENQLESVSFPAGNRLNEQNVCSMSLCRARSLHCMKVQ